MAGITVDFNANLAQLQAGINQANQQLSGFADNASRVADGLSSALGAIGIGLSVGGMAALVKATIDEADALDVLNQKTGVAVETLSGLKLGAQLNDTELESVASAMNRLGRQVATNSEEFAKLGVTAKDPLGALEQFADVFAGIEDPMQRAALANKVFGKSWEELAPLLSGGGKALAQTVAEGQKLSGITAELAAESAKFNDTIDLLNANLVGFRNKAVGPLVPKLNDLIDYFNQTEEAASESTGTIEFLDKTYTVFAETVAFVGFGFQLLGKSAGALGDKLGAILSLDFDSFDAIDEAFKKDMDAANERLKDFFTQIESRKTEFTISAKVQAENGSGGEPVDLSGGNAAVQEFLKTGEDGQKILSETFKKLQADLKRHLGGIEANIDEEISLFDYRNKQLEVALDLGLVDQETYYQQKQQLQREQLAETEALLDQEINALRQFQSEATDEATKTDAQDKINALLREKTELERQANIATLQNAAAAQQALGGYADGLVNVNDLLQGVASNIIGLSKAQAELNLQIGGTASAADVLDKSKIFVSEDGKSFSDRPTEVGIEINLDENTTQQVQEQLVRFRDQAIADSAVLLGVNIDQAAALAKVNEASSAINQKLDEIKPVTLGMDVDQALVINAAQRARDAAQAAVQPVIIPVIYQTQNTPASATTAVAADLVQAALANGGR